jgi:hypothetical protein
MQIYSRACIGRDDETVTGDWKAHGGRRRSLQIQRIGPPIASW